MGTRKRDTHACDDWVPDDRGWHGREPGRGEYECVEVVRFEGCVDAAAATELLVEGERLEEGRVAAGRGISVDEPVEGV